MRRRLNIGAAFAVKGKPLPMRLESGPAPSQVRPCRARTSRDRSRRSGHGVTHFRPGDEVYGVAKGTCAEYVRVPEEKVAIKPINLTYEEAAALPVSAPPALHGPA